MRKVLDDIGTLAMTMDQKGWAEGNAGNISVNVTGSPGVDPDGSGTSISKYPLPGTYPALAGQYMLISGAGTRMRNLAKQPLLNLLLLRISDDGSSFVHLPIRQEIDILLRPSSEFMTHLAIHEYLLTQGRTEKAVVHAHVNELIALTLDPKVTDESILNQVLGSILSEMSMMIPKGLGLIPFLEPGSRDVARATAESLQKHDMILWARHGVITVGTDLYDCLDKIEIVTKAAKIYFLVRPL
jgi:rhamnulose-1-phosphate aldolase